MQCIELNKNSDDSSSAIRNTFESELVYALGFPSPSVSNTKNYSFSCSGFFAVNTFVSNTSPFVHAWIELPTWNCWFSKMHWFIK